MLALAFLVMSQVKRETVTGLLIHNGGTCMLANSEVVAELERCGVDDFTCRSLATLRGSEGPFGLEDDFCTAHPSALGRSIEVRGTRASCEGVCAGSPVGGCFEDVELTHVAPQIQVGVPAERF